MNEVDVWRDRATPAQVAIPDPLFYEDWSMMRNACMWSFRARQCYLILMMFITSGPRIWRRIVRPSVSSTPSNGPRARAVHGVC